MKKILYILGMLAVAVSCTKEEQMSVIPGGDLINFSAAELSRVTDNGSTLSWDAGDQVTIISSDGSLSALYDINSSTGTMSYNSGDKFYTDSDLDLTFYAWSPAALSNSGASLPLDLSSQAGIEQVVCSSVTTANTEAEFTFSPIYTKVNFSLTVGYLDVVSLEGATATLSGANIKADYDFATASFVSTQDVDVSSVMDIASDGATATVSFYVLETPVMNGNLIIEVGGMQYYIPLGGRAWEEGMKYDYNATVGGIAPQMVLADFGTTYTLTSLPSEDTWVITDSGAPSTAQFVELKNVLRNLNGKTIKLVFPSLTELPYQALYHALAMESFYSPYLNYISSGAFYGCTGLTGDLVIADGVTYIGIGAYQGCTSLNGTLTLPSSLVGIDMNAFAGCSSITGDLDIPQGVSLIEDGAFYGCSGLTSITVNWTSSIPNIFQDSFPDEFKVSTGSSSISIPFETQTLYEAVTWWNIYNLSERAN